MAGGGRIIRVEGDVRTLGALLVALGLVGASLAAQTGTRGIGADYGVDPNYTVPRTPDGHPDLQGVWGNNGVTPMTRPPQWKDKGILTDAELEELKAIVAKFASESGDAIFQNQIQLALDAKEKGKFDQTSYDAATGNYNQFWMAERDWDHRTSLVVDPPTGLIPPLTEAAKTRPRANNRRTGNLPEGRPDGPEDLPLSERCVSYGAPRTGAGYNSYLQIVQSGETVVLQQEMIHDARIVSTSRRPHLPASVRQLHGDPVGWWDGDTLVVETTNYEEGFMGSTPDVKLTERYRRVSQDYINWSLTVDDPNHWTRPWTMMIRLKRTDDPIYEYACHEGNLSMIGILAGARMDEQKEAAAKAGGKRAR
jgi:hypothetical protein